MEMEVPENSEFKPVKLRFEIGLVSYLPAQEEGLGKYDKFNGNVKLKGGFPYLLDDPCIF